MYGLQDNMAEFIQRKIDEGNWVHEVNDISAAATVTFVTPAANKRFHLYSAKVVLDSIAGTAIHNLQTMAELLINGTKEDETFIGSAGNVMNTVDSGGAWGIRGDGKFDVTGLYLDGDAAKVVAIKAVSQACVGTITGWLEDI